MSTAAQPKAKRPDEIEIPGGLAVALATGRPELARVAMSALRADGTSIELVNTYIDSMSDYAEALVKEVTQERQNLTTMVLAIENAYSNIRGALLSVERVGDALREMQKGAAPDVVADMLRNPLRKSKHDARDDD